MIICLPTLYCFRPCEVGTFNNLIAAMIRSIQISTYQFSLTHFRIHLIEANINPLANHLIINPCINSEHVGCWKIEIQMDVCNEQRSSIILIFYRKTLGYILNLLNFFAIFLLNKYFFFFDNLQQYFISYSVFCEDCNSSSKYR